VDLSVWIKQLFKQTCYVYNSLGNSSHSANANTSTIRYVCCYNTLLQPNQFNSLQRPDKFEPLSNNSNISEMMSPMTQCRGRRKSTTKLISISIRYLAHWQVTTRQHWSLSYIQQISTRTVHGRLQTDGRGSCPLCPCLCPQLPPGEILVLHKCPLGWLT